MALADELANGEEVGEPDRVGSDLDHSLLDVGNDVEQRHAHERRLAWRSPLFDHVGRAVPVVADEEHGNNLARITGGRGGCGGRRRHGHARRKERRCEDRDCLPAYWHH
jgi:hypothetical protein